MSKCIKIMAVVYSVTVYLSILLFLFFSTLHRKENSKELIFPLWALGIPVLLGIVYLIIIRYKYEQIKRKDLLDAVMLIKYTMIPIYIVGGLLIAIFALLTFTPVVIMIFVGPTVVFFLSLIGWLYMVSTIPFTFAYLKKAKTEQVHHAFLCNVVRLCQFFFLADVISIAILALKEKRWVKSTISLLIILGLGILAIVVMIFVLIIRALVSGEIMV